MKKEINQSRLKKLLSYNSKTGIFTNLTNRSSMARKGCVSGCKIPNGYIVISLDHKQYFAHRLAFLYMEGYMPENQVDHINRIKHSNKWENLREVSRSCNAKNSKKRSDNKSGITGVSWFKRDEKWSVRIKIKDRYLHVGLFENKIEAAEARWNVEKKYNFPNCNTTSSAYLYLKNNKKA